MNIQEISPFDYFHVLDARNEPSLVIVTSPACGACRRLTHILQEAQLDVDGLKCWQLQAAASVGLLEELEVFHLPAMFLYAQGDCLGEIQCVLTVDAIRAQIVRMLSEEL